MKRRQFFQDLGLGYSLVVLAGPSPAQPPPITDPMRREFDRIAPPAAPRGRAEGEPHLALVDLETDVFIAGGGLAGVCAALAAARNGAKVVLVQDRSRLGGNSSSEVKMHVVGADCHTGRPGWRESGLIEELRLDDAVNNPQRSWELWDLLLYDKVVSEPNITLLLETVLYRAEVDGNTIRQVWARCDKSELLYRVKAKIFIDASGDSRLGLEAGAEMRTGRESRREFNESLAPEKPDAETLGSSILFTSRLHRRPMPFRAPSWARKIGPEQLRFRNVGPENWEYGYWWVEWGGDRDIIRDNERIRFELLSIVLGVWGYIKNSGAYPASANWALEWVGMMPGKRGSRRLVGDHILTQGDLERGTFADAVAIGGWPMDDHPPGGFDRPDLPPARQIRTAEVFEIPYRSLYSRNIANLMMAGRNISATHTAFTSTRVMATCAAVGQATGTAAQMCVERGLTPRALAKDAKLVSALQQTLLRDDQALRSVRGADKADLARSARLTASAELPDAPASRVLDGVLRDIPNKDGSPREVHRWSALLTPEGAWIELSWDRPQRITRVQITFDSGFRRQLTLSASDRTARTCLRQAQPETVRDYRILCRNGLSDWKQLAAVKGNHQRLNRHRFDPFEADSIRIQVDATNGDELAQIFEIRCYA